MKKEHEIVERLAFHIVLDRHVASQIANDGLKCDQLSMPIDAYLGVITCCFVCRNTCFH